MDAMVEPQNSNSQEVINRASSNGSQGSGPSGEGQQFSGWQRVASTVLRSVFNSTLTGHFEALEDHHVDVNLEDGVVFRTLRVRPAQINQSLATAGGDLRIVRANMGPMRLNYVPGCPGTVMFQAENVDFRFRPYAYKTLAKAVVGTIKDCWAKPLNFQMNPCDTTRRVIHAPVYYYPDRQSGKMVEHRRDSFHCQPVNMCCLGGPSESRFWDPPLKTLPAHSSTHKSRLSDPCRSCIADFCNPPQYDPDCPKCNSGHGRLDAPQLYQQQKKPLQSQSRKLQDAFSKTEQNVGRKNQHTPKVGQNASPKMGLTISQMKRELNWQEMDNQRHIKSGLQRTKQVVPPLKLDSPSVPVKSQRQVLSLKQINSSKNSFNLNLAEGQLIGASDERRSGEKLAQCCPTCGNRNFTRTD